MKQIETAAIVGTGAIGAVVLNSLQSCDPGCVSLVADPQRRERYLRGGLFLNDRPLELRFADGPADLLIVAVKATALDGAIEAMRPHVGPDTLILSLLNGLDSEERLGEAFGPDRVPYAYYLGHTAVRTDNRMYHDGHYHLYFGEKTNVEPYSERVERIRRFFDRTGVPCQIPADMVAAQWQKWVMNVGLNQATALLRCNYDHLMNDREANRLTRGLVDEAVAVARARGIEGAETMGRRAMELLDTMIPSDRSSMAQDVEAGRPTEVAIFAGALCRMAEQYGVDAPLNRRVLAAFS